MGTAKGRWSKTGGLGFRAGQRAPPPPFRLRPYQLCGLSICSIGWSAKTSAASSSRGTIEVRKALDRAREVEAKAQTSCATSKSAPRRWTPDRRAPRRLQKQAEGAANLYHARCRGRRTRQKLLRDAEAQVQVALDYRPPRAGQKAALLAVGIAEAHRLAHHRTPIRKHLVDRYVAQVELDPAWRDPEGLPLTCSQRLGGASLRARSCSWTAEPEFTTSSPADRSPGGHLR